MRISHCFRTFSCVFIFGVSASAQLTTPPRYAVRLRQAERRTDADQSDVALFGSIAAQFVDKRAYVQTAPLAGYFGDWFTEISVARVVSATETSDATKQQQIRDREASVTTFVQNGGEEVLRLIPPIKPIHQGSRVTVLANVLADLLGVSGKGDTTASLTRASHGIAAEARLTAALSTHAHGSDTTAVLTIGGRVGTHYVWNGPIVTGESSPWIPGYQLVVAISRNNVVQFGGTFTKVPRGFSPYIPSATFMTSASLF